MSRKQVWRDSGQWCLQVNACLEEGFGSERGDGRGAPVRHLTEAHPQELALRQQRVYLHLVDVWADAACGQHLLDLHQAEV